MKNIKTVFFDSDNTLVDHYACERQALIYLFDNINEKYIDKYQDIFRPLDRELWDSVAHGTCVVPKSEIPKYRFKKFFEKLNIKYLNYEKANKLFQDGLSKATALLDDTEEIIEYLYSKGYGIYVVTNGLVKLQKPRIINTSISKYISDIIVSEEVGAFKPQPMIFNVLLQKIHLQPYEVVMVGDSLKKDIQGAKNANIFSIWFNPDYKKNTSNIIPDYEIHSLLDLKNSL